MSTIGRIQDGVSDLLNGSDAGYGGHMPGLVERLGLTDEQRKALDKAIEDFAWMWYGFGLADTPRLDAERITQLEQTLETKQRFLTGVVEWRDRYRDEAATLQSTLARVAAERDEALALVERAKQECYDRMEVCIDPSCTYKETLLGVYCQEVVLAILGGDADA